MLVVHHYVFGLLTQAAKLARNYSMSRVYVHEVGLYQVQTPSLARIDIILECFSSARDYLNSFLTCSPEELASWTVLEWRTANYAVMVVTRAATILDSFAQSVDSQQRADWIDDCLDNSIARMKTLQTLTTSNPNSFFASFASEWEHAKQVYQRSVREALGESQGGNSSDLTSVPLVDTSFDMDAIYNMTWNSFGLDPDPSNMAIF